MALVYLCLGGFGTGECDIQVLQELTVHSGALLGQHIVFALLLKFGFLKPIFLDLFISWGKCLFTGDPAFMAVYNPFSAL